ncbi:ribosomal protein L7/L12 [Actinokineospora auranticolor]|uniref:Ribosomal L7/L12-like protein n=1 Tax=Actinokineospora auranticolor TaxID=155976 RepID=A0A2S6GDX3_9PSEU|nr:ribosomal protein L7/L12 [Actinokineospora auranticolor]PPK63438.1 ribosomal L7/L12-like protein [Actinokineospora auranticolor]
MANGDISGYRNDEPSPNDLLDREKIARALANTVQVCETPLVVGIYGSWGTGKTTLMELVRKKLEGDKVPTIWFDPWRHQFDDNPVVALLHTMVDKVVDRKRGKELLTAIASALTDSVITAAPLFHELSDFHAYKAEYEESLFEVRERRVQLRESFAKLMRAATNDGEVRLVFFIDDLDRCLPKSILKTLEALKLFLNMPGCVYVLGVDREALENSINTTYSDRNIAEQYLDKIVQVPFTLPPVSTGSTIEFVRSLLPDGLHDIAEDIVAGLGTNPRRIKRFVNSLVLNHELAKQTFADQAYNAKLLAALLVVQYQRPKLYRRLAEDRLVLLEGAELDKVDAGTANDPMVRRLVTEVERDPSALDGYVFLSTVAGVRPVEFDVVVTKVGEYRINVIKVIREHSDIGLKEARDLVDSQPPILVASGLSRAAAEELVEQIRAVDGQAEIR